MSETENEWDETIRYDECDLDERITRGYPLNVIDALKEIKKKCDYLGLMIEFALPKISRIKYMPYYDTEQWQKIHWDGDDKPLGIRELRRSLIDLNRLLSDNYFDGWLLRDMENCAEKVECVSSQIERAQEATWTQADINDDGYRADEKSVALILFDIRELERYGYTAEANKLRSALKRKCKEQDWPKLEENTKDGA